MTVKFAAGFGKDEARRNGFSDIQNEIVKKFRTFNGLAVVWVDCKNVVQDVDKQEDIPTVRILAAEPLDGDHETWARKVLDLRYRNRTGNEGFTFPEDDDDPPDNFLRDGSGVYVSPGSVNEPIDLPTRPTDASDDWDPADDIADAAPDD